MSLSFGLNTQHLSMWARYRKWKHSLIPLLVMLATLCMAGGPDDSARWKAGMSITVLLGITYLAEEIVWIAQNRGRPCANCGEKFHLRPFSLRVRCPHCGHWE
jgi:hypothetical protein